jgi:hypothetical protein
MKIAGSSRRLLVLVPYGRRWRRFCDDCTPVGAPVKWKACNGQI